MENEVLFMYSLKNKLEEWQDAREIDRQNGTEFADEVAEELKAEFPFMLFD